VVSDPTTGPEDERRHALLWALAEFREDLVRLIDEQLALAANRAVEPAAAVEPLAPPAPKPLAPTPTLTPPAAEPEPAPVRAAPVTPRPRPREVSPPAPAPAEPAAAARGDDPRQRLDALAKLLDRRLKQTAAPTGEPASKGDEG
jgi:hypothetical protein